MNLHIEFVEIFKATVSLITIFVSGFVGAYFALSRFKKEKFWDERRGYYKAAIGAMEELRHWSEQERAIHCCEPSSSVPSNPDEAFREISKLSVTGALIFSTDFYNLLTKVEKEISTIKFQVNEESTPDRQNEQKMNEWKFHYVNEIKAVVEESLPKLIEMAKRELPKNA